MRDKSFLDRFESVKSLQDLENLKVEILGKKGILTQQFALLKELSQEEKKAKAQELNALKNEVESKYAQKKSALESDKLSQTLEKEKIDVSLFNIAQNQNAQHKNTQKASVGHPINYTKDKIISYFVSKGYELCEGPLVEDDFHNFTALNLPKYHPAREMQDTFYFNDSKLLRTHTSPVQIRTMLSQRPPIKMICPGATFRRDYDLTHSPMFHQIEGLLVDEAGKVSFANLKYALENFLRFMFGEVRIRFRSSFFPFTEPSAEVDISCIFCDGGGCRVCSHSGWLEVLGCGLVNDNVFKAVGYENVSGYAFGLGIERLCMLSLGISDMRSLFENDLGLLEQF